jgi:hypothetical protein
MNVFEDLIEELRGENLLEETVIDLRPRDASAEYTAGTIPVQGPDEPDEAGSEQPDDQSDGRDFYRKRAMDEVSSLQMVEHVLSGIEREHMKVVPGVYDDLEVKKALHKFLQVQTDPSTSDYAAAEFQLIRETEAWSTALSERDAKISVANLRRFCENSRPVLSSQALMSLARFYRNAAYCEASRAKFDLVMTRLFSRESGDAKRRLLFGRVDMVGHIKTLYANWSSVALYSADGDTNIRAVVAGFEDRLTEAESAETFEKLIEKSFFDKVHEFKQATGEMFFTPEIVAIAIDCNIRVGNKFVDLIQLERSRTNPESVEKKYGYEYDQIISDAAGRTLQLVEILKSLPEPDAEERSAPKPTHKSPTVFIAEREKASRLSSDLFRVNKWLLAVTVLVLIGSIVVYFWAGQATTESSSAENANDVDLSTTELNEFLRSGRSTSETLYAITRPSWDQLTDAKKKEILERAREFGQDRGLTNVRFVNVRGDLEAFSSRTRSEILHPSP